MKEYDPNKPTKYITYLDANNLHGSAMCKPHPTHGLEWMEEDELVVWKYIPCILEVDLDYPRELHNDYPLAPELLGTDNVEKLIPNLYKSKYIIHHETTKLYESLGLKITKIHRGIKFEKSAWLKPYIELNTILRTKATNDFFKLMNNSVFGKTMENIRNRVDIHLVTNEKQTRKLLLKLNYKHRTIFSENLSAVHMMETK